MAKTPAAPEKKADAESEEEEYYSEDDVDYDDLDLSATKAKGAANPTAGLSNDRPGRATFNDTYTAGKKPGPEAAFAETLNKMSN